MNRPCNLESCTLELPAPEFQALLFQNMGLLPPTVLFRRLLFESILMRVETTTGADPGSSQRGSMKGGRLQTPSWGAVDLWGLPPRKFLKLKAIFNDVNVFEYLISKIKMPFFEHQNV